MAEVTRTCARCHDSFSVDVDEEDKPEVCDKCFWKIVEEEETKADKDAGGGTESGYDDRDQT